MLGEPVQPPGHAGGQRRDRPGRQRDAGQLRERQRGPLLRQELPGVQVNDDRGDPRPVLNRGLYAPGAPRPWCDSRSRTPARSADARSPRPAPAAGQRPGAAPPRSPAAPPARPRTGRSSPAHGGPPGPAWPPAPASSPYARPARRACGHSASAATAAPACPALTRRRPGKIPRVLPQPGLKLRDPLTGLRQLRPRLLQRAYPPRPVPGAAMPPARPAPQTTLAPLYWAHPDITRCEPRDRQVGGLGRGVITSARMSCLTAEPGR